MKTILSEPVFLLLLGNVLSICLYSYMHSTFYGRKIWFEEHRWAVVPVYILACIAWTAVNMIELPPINFAACVLAYLIPLFLCYEVKTLRGLAYFVFFLVGMMVTELCLGLITGVINGQMEFRARYDMITPMVSLIMNMMEIIMVLLICRFGNKDRDKRYDKITRIFMIMPLFSTLIIVADLYMMGLGKVQDYNSGQMIRMSIFLVLVNIAIFITLEKYTDLCKKDFALVQEEMKLQADADMLEMAARSMSERLGNAERIVQRERTLRHDRRHFEALLISLLEEGKTDVVRKYLEERLAQEPRPPVRYCENATVNAAMTYYIHMAEKKNIQVIVSTHIPERLRVDDMQLAIAICNLIENAVHACEKLPEDQRRIEIRAKYRDQLLMEIVNSCEKKVELDEEGYPYSREENHGIGTKSVLAFINQTDSEIRYLPEDKTFTVRMII